MWAKRASVKESSCISRCLQPRRWASGAPLPDRPAANSAVAFGHLLECAAEGVEDAVRALNANNGPMGDTLDRRPRAFGVNPKPHEGENGNSRCARFFQHVSCQRAAGTMAFSAEANLCASCPELCLCWDCPPIEPPPPVGSYRCTAQPAVVQARSVACN